LHLAAQLLSSEVVAPALIAQRFVAASAAVRRRGPEGAAAAWGWLNLARLLCDPTLPSELGDAMVQAGCIAVSANLMVDQAGDAPTQLKGIEAMSAIIGDRWAGLHAFAEVAGIALVVAAMRSHGGDVRVQTKGVKALSCGIQWPQDLQAKAGYSYCTGIELTKSAMAQHPDSAELQIEGLVAFAKYLDKLSCVSEVRNRGGEGLVKAIMTRHSHVKAVQSWGKVVLDALGSDRNWQPRAAGGPA